MSIRKWISENNSGKLQKTTTTTNYYSWAHERQKFIWRAKGWCGKNLIKVREYGFLLLLLLFFIRFWVSDSHVILTHSIQFILQPFINSKRCQFEVNLIRKNFLASLTHLSVYKLLRKTNKCLHERLITRFHSEGSHWNASNSIQIRIFK